MKNEQDLTPIHIAVSAGNLEIIKLLANHGVEIDEIGDSYLDFAVKLGHMEVVEFLVQNGAEINRGLLYNTPLDIAIENKHENIVEFLKQHGAERSYDVLRNRNWEKQRLINKL